MCSYFWLKEVFFEMVSFQSLEIVTNSITHAVIIMLHEDIYLLDHVRCLIASSKEGPLSSHVTRQTCEIHALRGWLSLIGLEANSCVIPVALLYLLTFEMLLLKVCLPSLQRALLASKVCSLP